jgi:hypothetical protein
MSRASEPDRHRHECTGLVTPEQNAGLPIETEALELEDATLRKRLHASPECPEIYRNL